VRYREMDGQFSSDSVTLTRRKTVYFLLGSLLLAIGTPAYLALTRSGARFYLLQPMIFAMQAIPRFLAAALWLPWRSARASRIGLRLAGVLFFADVLLDIPILTGLLPTGGDMIARSRPSVCRGSAIGAPPLPPRPRNELLFQASSATRCGVCSPRSTTAIATATARRASQARAQRRRAHRLRRLPDCLVQIQACRNVEVRPHSARSASIAFMRSTRRAGVKLPAIVIAIVRAATAAKVAGSPGGSPARRACSAPPAA
jgi:hypothetical protein